MENPETTITKRIRSLIELRGWHFVKLSDSFTRGVPDSFVAAGGRVVFIEFKVDRLKSDAKTYKQLGLSGAQDHHIRAINRNAPMGAIVVSDYQNGGNVRVWLPGDGDQYDLLCAGHDQLLRLLSGVP